MSCSARLPVYILLTSLFVPAGQTLTRGLVLFAMYSLGVLVAIPVAWVLKKTWFRGETPPFVMELPSYKIPSPRIVLARVYDRGKAFVVRAGTLIFATTIIVWALGYFPADRTGHNVLQAEIERLETAREALSVRDPQAEQIAELDAQLESQIARQNELSARLIENSFLGRLGHFIAPAVRPLGWDWKLGVGALASFPAREVIISTLGTIYSLGSDVDEQSEGLKEKMREQRWPDGRAVYTVPVALSVMVFFALCAQCAATLMVIRRETNSWFWPAFTFSYMTALAYLGALATYHIGTLLAQSWS
jgi:ferrous iron transport protein B